MVQRMAKRGLVLAAIVALVMWAWQGPFYAWSSLVGSALTVGNLWFSARLIGATVENNPKMLLPVGLATFTGGLLALTAISAVLMLTDLIYFPATGFTLIGMHFVLVLSEAVGSAKKTEPSKIEPSRS